MFPWVLLSCSSKSSNPRGRRPWEPPICIQVGQKLQVDCYLQLASEVGGRSHGIWRHLRGVSVKIKLNSKTPSWCWRTSWYGEKHHTIWCQKWCECSVRSCVRVKEKHKRRTLVFFTPLNKGTESKTITEGSPASVILWRGPFHREIMRIQRSSLCWHKENLLPNKFFPLITPLHNILSNMYSPLSHFLHVLSRLTISSSLNHPLDDLWPRWPYFVVPLYSI